jgi:hypothetical protein
LGGGQRHGGDRGQIKRRAVAKSGIRAQKKRRRRSPHSGGAGRTQRPVDSDVILAVKLRSDAAIEGIETLRGGARKIGRFQVTSSRETYWTMGGFSATCGGRW